MTEYKDVEAEFWAPKEVNDSVAGNYFGMQENVGENKSKVYHLQQEDGHIISVWGSTVLDSKIQLVKVGTDIKIIFLGEKKGDGKKRAYKDFKVQQAIQEKS
jgi:hypothetical protein